jgi:hypothetical protein
MASSDLWHRTPPARALLAALTPSDLRLVRDRGGPGPEGLAWYPYSDHGAATFEALAHVRRQAIGPTVAGAIALHFGDPERWRGFGPIEATRRFHAWASQHDPRHAI